MTALGMRTALRGAVGILLLASCGCDSGPKVAPVSGQVTLDGKPLPEVRLHFQPVMTPSQAKNTQSIDSFATTDANGHYTLQLSDTGELGALVGAHSVRITDSRAESDQDAGDFQKVASRVPPHYADGSLNFEVKSEGSEAANFQLTSK